MKGTPKTTPENRGGGGGVDQVARERIKALDRLLIAEVRRIDESVEDKQRAVELLASTRTNNTGTVVAVLTAVAAVAAALGHFIK